MTFSEHWSAQRLPSDLVHLDIAACGRISTGVLDAQIAHVLAEASGGYVAEADALPLINGGKTALGALLGRNAADVAYVDSGATAFSVFLAGWPLPRGARIGTTPSEYGGNAMVLRLLAEQRGWTLVELPVDTLGRITEIPAGLDLITFPQIASQCGVLQPVADVLASGVPLVLDIAQSLGQAEVPLGAAGYVGTSRKWLCGPRGVGFLVVDPAWETQLIGPANLATAMYTDVRRFEAPEGHIAGRVGLAVALEEWSPELLPVLQATAKRARTLLVDIGLSVVEPVDTASGITTVLIDGDDVLAARSALLRVGIVTTAVPTSRAAEMDRPVLRISTGAWTTDEDLTQLGDVLARRSR